MVKTVNLTQEALVGAIDRLVKVKSFTNITVSELTKVAGVSRPTFYRHYHNIVEVLNFELATMLADFKATVSFHNNSQYILQMVYFFQRYSTTVKILLAAGQEGQLRQKIASVMIELSQNKPAIANLTTLNQHYYIVYHTTGLMTVIVDWVAHDQPETPEQLAKFLDENSRQIN
ncbi:TetR/AcrR family transcriptional regulator [Lactiplantibacillus sp. DA1]|uniref:TetR/AcrR family transcriptional regulator n=1 Tax=Lactiplantibacillus sp. DA1 TaxID=3079857 RepID=UPI00292A6694|nr:TetR/AcrR family transcriptional regulator [Lactiplantibacillus sp. DA1]MDV0430548.1 TetR/AcrR family transcriptional regulator [Lactiplantibacillus sp. DA1]